MSRGLLGLNDHLFEQLDRLTDTKLSPKELKREIERSKAVVGISDAVVANANTQLKAAKLFADHGPSVLPHLPQIGKDAK